MDNLLQVTGTNKSVYFTGEDLNKAGELMRELNIDSLSGLIAHLIRERHAALQSEERSTASRKKQRAEGGKTSAGS